MRAAQLALSAFAAYVAVRAAFIFGGAVGTVPAVVALAAAAFAAWRRSSRPLAAGLVLGAAASAVALTV